MVTDNMICLQHSGCVFPVSFTFKSLFNVYTADFILNENNIQ